MDLLLNSGEYLFKAHDLIEEWQYIEAKRVLEELLEDEPDNAQAHHMLGNVYRYGSHQLDKAAYHLKFAIRCAPQYPFAYYDFVLLLGYLGRYQEAIEWIDKALALGNMERSWLLRQKATAHELLQRYNEALSCLDQALLAETEGEEICHIRNAWRRVKAKIKKGQEPTGYTGKRFTDPVIV